MKFHSLALTILASATLHAQEPHADPFRETKGEPANAAAHIPKNASICYETFSMPLAMAAKLQRESPGDGDLYKQILAAVEKNTARQETFAVIRCKSGMRAISESLSEQMSPGKYAPPEIPNSLAISSLPVEEAEKPAADTRKPKNAPASGDTNGVQTPATPTDFTVRKTGVTVQVEPTLGESDEWVDLMLMPSHVALAGRSAWGQGLATSELPIFETQNLTTAATLKINQPFLFGTLNRAPDSKLDPDSANRVWFAFVTVTLAKP